MRFESWHFLHSIKIRQTLFCASSWVILLALSSPLQTGDCLRKGLRGFAVSTVGGSSQILIQPVWLHRRALSSCSWATGIRWAKWSDRRWGSLGQKVLPPCLSVSRGAAFVVCFARNEHGSYPCSFNDCPGLYL